MKRIYTWYSRRNVWSRRLILFLGGLIMAIAALWLTPTPYYITAPMMAADTSRMVAVHGGEAHRYRLYMLTVAAQPANLFWYLYAKIDSRAELETSQQFLGGYEDYDKYVELTRQMMADSQETAKAVGLQQAGYGQGVRLAGAVVTDLTTDSPSRGYLQAGDVLVEVAGQPVPSAADLTAIMKSLPARSTIPVKLRRGDVELTLEVPSGEHPDAERKGTAAFGVFIKDKRIFDIPVPIEIKAGAITGPSAGLMFTLQIIDQLTPDGITGDLVVAGTGTIEADGRVGPIGGMRQKVYAAEAGGAQVLFVPQRNYEEASKAATRIRVVPVDHVRDALEWLKAHAGKAGA